MRTSTRNTVIALFGLMLLMPFSALFAIGTSALFLKTLGLSNAVNESIGSLIMYHPLSAKVVFFVFPLVAFLINFIVLIFEMIKAGKQSAFTPEFAKANFLNLAVIVLAAGAVIVLFGHDAIPCFIHGINREGIDNIWPLIRICHNA